MYEQNASYLVKHSDLGAKKLKKNLPKNCSKISEIATTVCKFPKNFRESMLPDPKEPYFILGMLKIILPEKTALENMSKFGESF